MIILLILTTGSPCRDRTLDIHSVKIQGSLLRLLYQRPSPSPLCLCKIYSSACLEHLVPPVPGSCQHGFVSVLLDSLIRLKLTFAPICAACFAAFPKSSRSKPFSSTSESAAALRSNCEQSRRVLLCALCSLESLVALAALHACRTRLWQGNIEDTA